MKVARFWRMAGSALAAVLILSAPASAAVPNPGPEKPEEILGSLGLLDGGDYVVALDMSWSMRSHRIEVQSALRELLEAVRTSRGRISVVPFNDTAPARDTVPLRELRDEADIGVLISSLPSPDGGTALGQGLTRALEVLEAGPPRAAASVVLITDAFAKELTGDAQWAQAIDQATHVRAMEHEGRPVTLRGYVLDWGRQDPGTGIEIAPGCSAKRAEEVVKCVFGPADTSVIRADDVAAHLAGLPLDVAKGRFHDLVAPDAERVRRGDAVTTKISSRPEIGPGRDTAVVPVRLTSTTDRLPLTVEITSIRSGDLDGLRLNGTVEKRTLQPHESVVVQVPLAWTVKNPPWALGDVGLSARVSFGLGLTSPGYSDLMSAAPDASGRFSPEGSAGAVSFTAPAGTAWIVEQAVLAVLALLVLLRLLGLPTIVRIENTAVRQGTWLVQWRRRKRHTLFLAGFQNAAVEIERRLPLARTSRWTPTTVTLYPSGHEQHRAAYAMDFRNGRARRSEYTRDVSVGVGLLGRLLARLGIRKAQ